MAEIERRRRKMHLPVEHLAAAGAISPRWYRTLRAGTGTPRPATLARLNEALRRHGLKLAGATRADAPAAAYKLSLVLAALMMKSAPRKVLAADPKLRRTLDPEWLAAARVRRIAYVIANEHLGIAQAELARIAGVTRSAISEGLTEIHDDADPALEQVLQQLEEIFG